MTPDLYGFANLWRQYRICRRNKRNTFNQLRFEVDAERNLLALQEELRAHTYRPGPSICFVTRGLKPREVFAADFRDRIVHHLLVTEQERVFEPRFIHDSYACRVGKGTLAASDRLMRFLRAGTANGRRPYFAMHLDVAGFFPSIDKEVLFALLADRVRHPELRWLTSVLLFHDPTTDYRFRALDERAIPPGRPGYPVPARKSLFGNDNRRGLPIGNLTSQFWANVYLNEVDQFAKRVLRCRYYLRYVDDLVLLSPDPEELRCWRAEIAGFLDERLRLRLRAAGDAPVPVGQGVDFVGWKTWWSHRVPRRRTLAHLRGRVRCFERQHVARAFGGLAWRLRVSQPPRAPRRVTIARPRNDLAELTAVLGSYGGHLRHGGAWRAWNDVWRRHAWLGASFELDGWRAAPRWAGWWPRAGESFRQAYVRLLWSVPHGGLVFLRVGRFVEFYGPQRLRAERVLGLRTAALSRAGYAFLAGFPVRRTPRFAARALAAGCAVVLARSREAGPGIVLLAPAIRAPVHVAKQRRVSIGRAAGGSPDSGCQSPQVWSP